MRLTSHHKSSFMNIQFFLSHKDKAISLFIKVCTERGNEKDKKDSYAWLFSLWIRGFLWELALTSEASEQHSALRLGHWPSGLVLVPTS